MKQSGFHRLHSLRMENDAKGYRMEEMRPRFDAMRTRHEDGTAPRAVTAFNLFQTPPALAAKMAELAELAELHEGQRVLEPSAGLGRLLTACEAITPGLEFTAVEESADCARELFHSRESLHIIQRDFLTVTPEETGLYDRVIMNPPFKMRRDIKHIQHALRFLKPGGLLVALCFGTDHRREAFESTAEHFEEIQSGTFRSEGTNVETFLIAIRNQN